jgi:hypothetical protein
MPSVRGSALLTRVAFVKERYGEDGYKRLLPLLRPETRQVLTGRLEARSWHPFESFVDLNVRADALFGKGDNRLCFDMGAYGADRNLGTLYRVFFQLGSVSFIMEKAAGLWSQHYDSGRLVSASEGPKLNTLRIEEFAAPHCAHCFSVMGWAARSVELTGASLVGAQRTGCRNWRDSACVMAFRLK